jgi:hypothetical protein
VEEESFDSEGHHLASRSCRAGLTTLASLTKRSGARDGASTSKIVISGVVEESSDAFTPAPEKTLTPTLMTSSWVSTKG